MTDKKQLLELDSLVIENLETLSRALINASEARFMSFEHAKSIWKAYLSVSGMDIPKPVETPKRKEEHVSKKG